MSSQGCSWGTGKCVWDAWGCFGVSSGVLGVLEGVGGLRGVSGSLFLPISFNFLKLQMDSLTFCNRPEGPKCLKYQNVPKLRSFWAIGKPHERFQSRVIKVYFIPLLLDHTVVWWWTMMIKEIDPPKLAHLLSFSRVYKFISDFPVQNFARSHCNGDCHWRCKGGFVGLGRCRHYDCM